MELIYYPEDMPLRWHITNLQIAKNVHVHTIDEENKHKILELPFEVKDNLVTSVLPANTKILTNPELIVEIKHERLTSEKADEIICDVHDIFHSA